MTKEQVNWKSKAQKLYFGG